MTQDYSEFMDRPAGDTDLAVLADKAEEQATAEEAVAAAKKVLQNAEDDLRQISWFDIPEIMDRLHLEKFKTSTGLEINVVEDIRANPPKDQKPAAYAWLRDNGHGRVLKRTVKLDFAAGDGAKADALVQLLADSGYKDVSDIENAHFMTLSALVREVLKDGGELPMELLGVFRQRRSKLG